MAQESLTQQNGGLKICVDEHAEGRIVGRVFGQRLRTPLPFSDAGQLLLYLNRLMDEQDFPQSTHRSRSFLEDHPRGRDRACLPLGGMDRGEVEAAKGQRDTFLLWVVSRRFSTWQGSLDWQDDSERQVFSSDLEFLSLLAGRFPF